MALPKSESSSWWVTTAADDEDAAKALELWASVRAAGSTHPLAVLIGGGVANAGALRSAFDYAVEVDTGLDVAELSLLAWKLPCKSALLLRPECLVLQPCEELFGVSEAPEFQLGALPRDANAKDGDGFTTSVFLLKPSEKMFGSLKRMLEEERDLGLGVLLNTAFAGRWTPLAKGGIIMTDDKKEREKIVGPALALTNVPGWDPRNEQVAVVGVACRLPDSNDEAEFWQVLVEGRAATRPLPSSRQWIRGAADVDGAETPVGYLKAEIDKFDARFFRVSRREAELLDPQQRLLLEVAWECLENAGIDPGSLAGTNTAVYAGVWAQEYLHLGGSFPSNSAQAWHFSYLGNAFCSASARISSFLGTRGPSVTVDAGCAASLKAVHYACEALRTKTTDLVICGGVNVALKSATQTGFDSFILSKDGKCRTFDADAGGFARGEACVMFLLKRLSTALRDGNDVLGLLAGSAVTSDGSGSMGTPNAVAQEAAIRLAQGRAGVEPHEVGYVEAHGTGTPVGDRIEFEALNAVFGDDPRRGAPLVVGSVKTNIGHTEGASGVAGLLKVLLAMRHHTIPRHLHLASLNPAIDITRIPAVIPSQGSMVWMPYSERGLLAGVSSFGLSGANVHLIVQEPPPYLAAAKTRQQLPTSLVAGHVKERSHHILTLSAASEPALEELVELYVALLEATPSPSIADVAFSANTGRAALAHRIAVVAENSGMAAQRLRKGQWVAGKAAGDGAKKVAFLFTGQGAQYAGMAKELYESCMPFKRTFDRCAAYLKRMTSLDLATIVADSVAVQEHSQVALFCVAVSLAAAWRFFGVVPDLVLGHSVGEFAAAVSAGLLSLADGLRLVVERSRLVAGLHSPGAMVVIKGPARTTLRLVSEFKERQSGRWIDVAALNSDEEVVISGPPDSVTAFEAVAAEGRAGLQTLHLPATVAYHSRAVDPILGEYGKVTADIHARRSSSRIAARFVSGALAREVQAEELDSEYWKKHLREPVRFADAFSVLVSAKVDVFVEIGPQPVLLALGMTRPDALMGCVWAPSIRRSEPNWSTILSSLAKIHTAGGHVDWTGLDREHDRRRLTLPNYPFQRERYWYPESEGKATSLTVNAALLHPLLGRRVPSPRKELATFFSSIATGPGNLAWVGDHRVVDTVILPATGFLEIMLAAASEIVGGGGAIPTTMQDLRVEAALPLAEDDVPAQLQTIVESVTTTKPDGSQELKCHVTIHKQTGFNGTGSDAGSWRQLASASFVPCASVDRDATQSLALDSIRTCMSEHAQEEIDDFYVKLAAMGINFGPAFRSITRAWTDHEGQKTLVETLLPEEGSGHVGPGFLMHPVVLDAMIQAVDANADLPNELRLPYAIDKFVALPRAWSPKLYILVDRSGHESTTPAAGQSPRVTLHNAGGECLALMEGLDLVPTTPDSFLRSIKVKPDTAPPFFDDTWLCVLGPTARRFDMAALAALDIESVCERVDTGLGKAETERRNGERVRSAELCYLYIMKSLRELGFCGKAGSCVSVSGFARDQALVCPQHEKLFRRFLQILGEEGDLVFEDSDTVRVQRTLPDAEELDARIQACISSFTGNYRVVDCQHVVNFGEHLSQLLQGKLSYFSLYVQEDKDLTGTASGFYTESESLSAVHRTAARCAVSLISSVLPAQGGTGALSSSPVLRILEVGAGVGATTEHMLREMAELGPQLQFEYCFTDISPHYLKVAAERYAGLKNVHFRVLDIERDPKSQGFAPHSFDVIVADMVLHATRDLAESVRHVRHLLVPGGLLFLVEVVHRVRALDMSFGFLDGWWRFWNEEHHDPLRVDHSCIPVQAWTDLLKEHGFVSAKGVRSEEFEVFETVDLVVAVADAQETTSARSMPTAPATALTALAPIPTPTALWLLLGEPGDPLSTALRTRLEAVGERVLLTSLAGEFSADLEAGVAAVPVNDEDAFPRLLQLATEAGFSLAGTVHLWSIRQARTVQEKRQRGGSPIALTTVAHDAALSDLTNGVFQLLQALLRHSADSRLTVVTAGVQAVSESDSVPADPVAASLPGLLAATTNENAGHHLVSIDVGPECGLPDAEAHVINEAAATIFAQLWLRHEAELQVAFRSGGTKHVRRVVQSKEPEHPLPLPGTERYQLQNRGTGSFADFRIMPAMARELNEGELEVAVSVSSLNFKDVLVALSGKEMQAGSGAEEALGLGLDFAGVITSVGAGVRRLSVGDRVFGVVGSGTGSLASHVVVPEANVCHMQDGDSFEAQAALGAVMLTVHYFLVQRGRIKRDDRILIHTASGGVGLVAVLVARHFGATVFATAGSARKRAYLCQVVGLEYVYNSRDTRFAEEILAATGGAGVDIVLNSLTSPGFKEASLSVCALGARFLEMSMLGIWSAEEVRALRPDVEYVQQVISGPTVAGSATLPEQDLGSMFALEGTLREVGGLGELPTTLFPLSRVQAAFRFLQSAKHIGKVVVKMPTTKLEGGVVVHKEELFNEFSSYLITGGLGGIGLEVAKWMAGSGAKHLVLVGRRPPTPRAQCIVEELRKTEGVKVLVLAADVSDGPQCERMLDEIEGAEFPPLRGIMHVAGVVPTAGEQEFGKLSLRDFLAMYRPKVHGTWNLHALTLSRKVSLDHFVLFSSVASTLGGFGQGNYVAANRYLDCFAAYRRSLGLPCGSIAWGVWSEVGVAAPNVGPIERALGLQCISPAQGIEALQRVMLEHRTSAVVMDVSDWKILRQVMGQGNLLTDIRTEAQRSSSFSVNEARIREMREAGPEEREGLVRELIESAVRDTLKLNDSEVLDPDANLRDLGIDSLMAMEVRTKIQLLLRKGEDRAVSLKAFAEAMSINGLTKIVVGILGGSAAQKELSPEELTKLVKRDCVLPEDIALPTELGCLPPRPSEFKHVLLTGATGQLGLFLLHELTASRPDITVHCLVRASSNSAAQDRLESALDELDLLDSIPLERVVCIVGSVTEENFGLSAEEYAALSLLIDAVIHSAAVVNHLQPYAEYARDSGTGDVRSTNVGGLLTVLRFAVQGKVKQVHHQSAIGVIRQAKSEERTGDDGAAVEGDTGLEAFPSEDDWGEVLAQNGYLLSKFVGEKLLKEAVERRGMSITLVRHNYLSGDTRTGIMNPRNSHALMFALACRRVKKIPDTGIALSFVPLDVSARAAVALFLHEAAQPGIYAVNNPAAVHIREIQKLFPECVLVSYGEWREAVLRSTSSELGPLADVYVDDLLSSPIVTEGVFAEFARRLRSGEGLPNSARLKELLPDIDSWMAPPLQLIGYYLDTYDATLGKNKHNVYGRESRRESA